MFHYSKAILKVGPRIISMYLFKMKKWAKHLDKYPYGIRYQKMRQLCKKIELALQIDLQVFGLENLPKDTSYLLVSNHMSAYDPLTFINNSDKPLAFVAKKELEKAPVVPTALKVLDCLCMDRNDLRQSLKVMLSVEDDLKKGVRSWAIFPEGTRIRDQLLPVMDFHHGTFRPAVKAGVPIVPCALYGTFRVLKKKPQFKKYPVAISILKPIFPNEYANMTTSDLALLTRNMIQKEITYHLRPLDHKKMSENNDKNYRFNDIL